MWILTIFFIYVYGIRTSLCQVGSPWHTGSDSDYYYEQLHPDDDLPVITTNDQQFDVNVGEPLVLPCPINNLGHFTLIWRRGGQILWVLQERDDGSVIQPVSKDPRVTRNGTSLMIDSVAQDDQNIYTCEVSTRPPRSVSHTLTVKVPPTVYPANNRSMMTIKMGDTANLRCIVAGHPVPVVTWTKADHNVPLGTGVNLTITNTDAKDHGIYRCTADNGAGDAVYSSINLQVMHPPTIAVEEHEVYSGVTYKATLACFVKAFPRPLVKWYRKNGSPVNPLRLKTAYDPRNKRYSLQFDRIQKEDFGNYTCSVSNFMGNATAFVLLTGRPKPVRYFSSDNGDKDTQYTLVWETESYSQILAYTIGYRNETDSASQWVNITVPGTTSSSIFHSKKHTFTGLEPGASYYVQIAATNEYGTSDVNDTFAFTTLDPVGTDPPEGLLHEEEEVVKEEVGEEDIISDTNQYQDVVSEVAVVSKSQDPLKQEENVDAAATATATAQSSVVSPTKNLTGIEEISQQITKGNEIPPAEKASVSDGGSGIYILTPRERRAQMVALVTAISLSSFFL